MFPKTTSLIEALSLSQLWAEHNWPIGHFVDRYLAFSSYAIRLRRDFFPSGPPIHAISLHTHVYNPRNISVLATTDVKMAEQSTWRRGTGLAPEATVPWLHTSVHTSTAIVHVHPGTFQAAYMTQATVMDSVLKTGQDGCVENAPGILVLG